MLQGHFGAGALTLPLAFYNVGILLGSILTVSIGLLYGHCVHMLVGTSQKLCKKYEVSELNYAQTAEKAFDSGTPWMKKYSRVAKIVVECGLMATVLNGSIIIIFAAKTTQEILRETMDIQWDVRIFILIVAIPELILSQIQYLKFLAPVSAIFNAFILTTMAIVLYYVFSVPLDLQNVTMFGRIDKLPTFLRLAIFE